MADDKPQAPPDGNQRDGNQSEGIKAGNAPSGGIIPSSAVLQPPRMQGRATPPPIRTSAKGPGPGDMKDSTREVIETIVFVVVLVLLLKTFLAEAFVIPTGSMATTLLGYHREMTCDQCSYHFLVNASSEAEDNAPPFTKCYCPNCRYLNVARPQPPEGELP